MEEFRTDNLKLAAWVQRNQEVLTSLKLELDTMEPKLPHFKIIYSSGTSSLSKTAPAHRANLFSSSNYLIPENLLNHKISNDAIPNNWSFNFLFEAAIPTVTTQIGNQSKEDRTIYLLGPDSTRVPANRELNSIFESEESEGHFDHFHLQVRSRKGK